MRRRDLIGGAAFGALLPSVLRGQEPDIVDDGDREEGAGRFVMTARGTFGTPRWDANQRVRGIHFIFNAYQPRASKDYFVAVYMQVNASYDPEAGRGGPKTWRDVRAVNDARGVPYRSSRTGAAREFIFMNGEGPHMPDPVYLFLPDAVMDLARGPCEFRHVIRFMDPQSNVIPGLEYTLPSYTGGVDLVKGSRKIFFGYAGVGALDIDICDVYKGKTLNLESVIRW